MISADRSCETLTLLPALASPPREVKASEAIKALFFTTEVIFQHDFSQLLGQGQTVISSSLIPSLGCFPLLSIAPPPTASSTEADPLRTMLAMVIDTWIRNGPWERANRHPIARRIGALHLLLYIESDELHQESPEHARSFQLDSVPRHHPRALREGNPILRPVDVRAIVPTWVRFVRPGKAVVGVPIEA
ncbi:hypothetical protein NL676_030637 [Syzygium grande]|nr:hypothetical protein NL676_030637 [Syzygium grande]